MKDLLQIATRVQRIGESASDQGMKVDEFVHDARAHAAKVDGRHVLWATLFLSGRYNECLEWIQATVPLYTMGSGHATCFAACICLWQRTPLATKLDSGGEHGPDPFVLCRGGVPQSENRSRNKSSLTSLA